MFSDEMTKRLLGRLDEGASAIGVALSPDQSSRLVRYLDLMLDWNGKINLTAITDPMEAVEHHLVDALAASCAVQGLASVMDIGTGGGVPGIPLAILDPGQQWVLVETVKKKVGFLKAAAGALGLRNVRSFQVRAEGEPEKEGLPLCEGAISRAFTSAPDWLSLARHYVTGKRAFIAMLGVGTDAKSFADGSPDIGDVSIHDYELPFSHIRRQVLRGTVVSR